MQTGRLISPFGTEFQGFQITVGGTANSSAQQNYDDIEKILTQNKVEYTVHHTEDSQGHFRSYQIST